MIQSISYIESESPPISVQETPRLEGLKFYKPDGHAVTQPRFDLSNHKAIAIVNVLVGLQIRNAVLQQQVMELQSQLSDEDVIFGVIPRIGVQFVASIPKGKRPPPIDLPEFED